MPCGVAPAGHECVEEITHQHVTVTENGRRANFRNPDKKSYRKIKVDGCLVDQETIADWIVTEVGEASVVIELKGKDIKKACTQLFATLRHKDCLPWLEDKVGLLIVCSRVPSFDSAVAKAKIQARKLGVSLTVKCSRQDCTIMDVVR